MSLLVGRIHGAMRWADLRGASSCQLGRVGQGRAAGLPEHIAPAGQAVLQLRSCQRDAVLTWHCPCQPLNQGHLHHERAESEYKQHNNLCDVTEAIKLLSTCDPKRLPRLPLLQLRSQECSAILVHCPQP